MFILMFDETIGGRLQNGTLVGIIFQYSVEEIVQLN